MKPKVYLETTIPSVLVARPSGLLRVASDQQITREWWERRRRRFQLHISTLVLDEVSQGDAEMVAARLEALKECLVLEAEHESRTLAEAILKAKLIPAKAATDAFHIATAAVFGMDFLLTWNCRHIANAFIADRIRAVCEREGYNAPVLCTPYELMIELE